jgi:hypothetical protein
VQSDALEADDDDPERSEAARRRDMQLLLAHAIADAMAMKMGGAVLFYSRLSSWLFNERRVDDDVFGCSTTTSDG